MIWIILKYFSIFVLIILGTNLDVAHSGERVTSDYAVPKYLQSEITTEVIVKRIEYTPNQVINGLTFIKETPLYIDPKSGSQRRKAIFRCYCGEEFETQIISIRNGNTKSCGCYQLKVMSMVGKLRITHGLSDYPIHDVWTMMKQRCYNKKCKRYKDWGGRGIAVCKEWKDNFIAFYNWAISNGYNERLQIDRINNDGDYEPSNCRFTTAKINANNRRNTKTKDVLC